MNHAELLKQYKEKKASQYGINQEGIFGSWAKGTPVSESDVDVVIEMNHPDIFIMVHIVDVVRNRQKMNPYLKKHIDKEAIYV